MRDHVRVGFIGAGRLATLAHYPSLAEMPDVTIAAIAELDAGRLAQAADQYHVAGRYVSYQEMLEREALDAVYVIMPPHHLFDIVVDCLQRGKHVFVEKPPGLTTYQTEAFAWHAANHGCLTMAGFNRRHIPMLRRAHALVTARGPVHQCLAAFHKHEASPAGYGFYRGATAHLVSDIIHAVDTLRWLAGGEAVDVAADNRALGTPYLNSHTALITFDSGCTAILTANRRAGKRLHHFELHGEHISVYADDQTEATVYRDGMEEGEPISAAVAAGGDAWHRRFGFSAENRHFIDCVKAGRQPESHFADAAKTMALCDRILAGQI